jgi:hypothetical protein
MTTEGELSQPLDRKVVDLPGVSVFKENNILFTVKTETSKSVGVTNLF